MNGRRAAIGLSLLCALAFSAFAAPSAMAAKGTTTFTCAQAAVEGEKFAEEHCNTPEGGGKFGHIKVKEGEPTQVAGTNENRKLNNGSDYSAVDRKNCQHRRGEITSAKVSSIGQLTNEGAAAMKAKGTAQIQYVKPEVVGLAGCGVTGGEIVAEANAQTEVEAAGAKEMWVTFQDKGANEVFTIFQFENIAACKGFKGIQIQVKGKAGARPNGATLEFKSTETKNTLTIGKELAGSSRYTGIETIRRTGGNPLTLATQTQ